MKKRQVAILDFGSSRLSGIVGQRGVNDTFIIKAAKDLPYEGFYEGEFLDPVELESVLEQMISGLSSECERPFDRLYVGVPGEFVSVLLKEKTLSYDRKRKITDREVNELYDAGLQLKSSKYEVVNRSAIYFVMDDKRRIVNPVGLHSDKLGGYISYSVADLNFEKLVRPMLTRLGVDDVVFVSSMLCESMFLFEPEQRDRFALLLDVGHLTSTLALIRGDGILYQKSIPFGGGHISADLSYYLSTDYAVADELKRKINISQKSQTASYELLVGEEIYTFGAEKANDVVRNNLDNLCEMLEDCFRKCEIRYPEYLPLHITGGGIVTMRGCKEHVANRINRVVESISPNLPTENKPTDSSKFGLLNYALMQEESENVGFFQKLFGRR